MLVGIESTVNLLPSRLSNSDQTSWKTSTFPVHLEEVQPFETFVPTYMATRCHLDRGGRIIRRRCRVTYRQVRELFINNEVERI
jgi:hypothetical protein